jgi:hypothetical protein
MCSPTQDCIVCTGAGHTLQLLLLLLLFFMSCSLGAGSFEPCDHIAMFLGPAPTGTWTIALRSNFWKFHLIRTGFFGESV